MKRVAILGGGPAGAFAAEQLAAAGMDVILFDEKLAWEKPCGGGLTYKAYSQYPFLIQNDTRQTHGDRDGAGGACAGSVKLPLAGTAADLLAAGSEPHAARTGPARRRARREGAGARNAAQRRRPLAPAHQLRQCGGGFLHRRHRRPQPPARRGNAAHPRRHHVRARLLRPGETRTVSTFSFSRAWKAISGFSRAAGTSRWGSAARASRPLRCAPGWSGT